MRNLRKGTKIAVAIAPVVMLLATGCAPPYAGKCVSSHVEERLVPQVIGVIVMNVPQRVTVCDKWESPNIPTRA